MGDLKKAYEIIENAKNEDAIFLDIGNLGLTELPDELFELKQLEFLNIGSRYILDNKLIKSKNSGELNIIKWIPWKIRKLTNLKGLSLHATYVGDISGLKELSGLKYLDLGFGYFIRDYSFLKYMRNIEVLNLHTNYVKELPFLGRFKKLKYLDISFNDIKRIDFLENLSRLENFSLQWYDKEIDISKFQHLVQLKHLNVASNLIVNHEYFKKLSGLESLNLYDTQTKEIEFLKDLTNLCTLNLWKNQIKNIDVLSNLISLTTLNLRENKIEDISILKKLKRLKELNVSFNQIKIEDLESEYKHLVYFKYNNNI